MTAADIDLRLAEVSRRRQGIWTAALLVSLLLHLLVVYFLTYDLPWSRKEDEEVPVPVSLVSPPPEAKSEPKSELKPPPPPPPVAEVKPELKAEPKPEPKPVPPKAEAKMQPPPPPPPAAKPVPKEAPKPEPLKAAAPPKPNLHPDQLAEKSAPPSAPLTEKEKAEHARKALDPATRSLSDLILSQVSTLWSPPAELRGHDYNIHFVIDLLPNGMFGPPFAADGPWNPSAALSGIDQMSPSDPRRVALLNFYRALRDIQPLRLPPNMASDRVRSVPVWFLLDDMP